MCCFKRFSLKNVVAISILRLKYLLLSFINIILGVLGNSSKQKKGVDRGSSSGPSSGPPSGGGKYFYVFLLKIF